MISLTTRIGVKSRAPTASVCIRRVTTTTDGLHRWRSSTPAVAARRAIACDSSPDFLGRLATAPPVRRVWCCRSGQRENLRGRGRSDVAKVTQAQAAGYAKYLDGSRHHASLATTREELRAGRGREQLCWRCRQQLRRAAKAARLLGTQVGQALWAAQDQAQSNTPRVASVAIQASARDEGRRQKQKPVSGAHDRRWLLQPR